MKNDRGVKLLNDDAARGCSVVPIAVDHGFDSNELGEFDAELARIDELLRLTADECTARIDFESIKARAVSAAKAKKNKRGRIRRAVSYALFACASLVIGFTVYSAFNSANHNDKNPNVVAYSSTEPKSTHNKGIDANKGGSGGDPIWRMEAGTVSDDTYKDITKKVSDLFPDALPETMIKLVDDSEAHITAVGTDGTGSEISYDFVMSTQPPIDLHTGEACSVEDGEYLVYYWQVSEENCVSVRFAGFEQQQADSMFSSLAKRIVQIVPNDGKR